MLDFEARPLLVSCAAEVLGMKCGSCVSRAETALQQLELVAEASVNLLAESARVRFRAPVTAAAVAEVQRALKEVGLEATASGAPLGQSGSLRSLRFEILGMSCASCVSTVEQAMSSVPQVAEVQVNLLAESAQVTLSTAMEAAQLRAVGQALEAAVEAAGFQAILKMEVDSEEHEVVLRGRPLPALDLEAMDDRGTQERALEDMKQVAGA